MGRGFRCAGLGLALVALTGCGDKMVKVNGKLIKGGQPMVVSEDTYVTISFVPEAGSTDEAKARAYSAKFDQKTGSYTVELPAGKYRSLLVIALPTKVSGKLNMPAPPLKSDVYDLTKDQTIDIEVPGK